MKYPFDSLRFWIGLFLFSVYLLSFSGKFHVMDELAVFTAGNNLAQHGRADINQLIWTNHWTPNPPGIWGQDNNLYTKKAPGISFITAPLIWLGHTIPDLNAVHVGLLTNSVVTALTASFLFVWLTDLGFSRLLATSTALAYGLCTIAWIYARMFWESSLLALTFLIALWAAYRATRLAYARQRLFWVLVSGTAMAIGVTLRFEAIPAIAFIALYFIWEAISWPIRQLSDQRWLHPPDLSAIRAVYQPPPMWQIFSTIIKATPWGRLVIFLTPVIVMSSALLYFNLIRYGQIAETGYSQELLFQAPWVGGFGLLFSPGRGLFIYAPFTLLLFFGLRPAWRRLSPAYFWLIIGFCLFYWLFYGSWFAWGGTWGWGPRFLLPILPLLMVFVAEPLDWVYQRTTLAKQQPPAMLQRPLTTTFAWLGITLLILLSLVVNLLGIAVDFNEHFLRLGRNDNFVFNWAAFPPLAHWQILQEGLTDLIWLGEGFQIHWDILTPPLLLFALATAGLGLTLRHELSRRGNGKDFMTKTTPHFIPRTTLYLLLFIILPLTLLYQMMTATARLVLEADQPRADTPLLTTLTESAQPDDVLLIPMPPFGDVQEVSTLMISYMDQTVPTSAWIESEPRAIQPLEREQITQATLSAASRIWLFERWLPPNDPPTPTALFFNYHAFPIQEQWLEKSGKLTLYSVADALQPTAQIPVNIPFQGGLTLVDVSLFDQPLTIEDSVLKVRLTWQAAEPDILAAQNLSAQRIVAFVQLLDEDSPNQNIAQLDRLLVDLQNFKQSPLVPGQKIQQGYGLPLPNTLTAGSYPLIVGLYEADSGQRLLRADNNPDDFLYLTNIIVTE